MNTTKKMVLLVLCATTLMGSHAATTTARRRDARIAGLLGLVVAGVSIMNRILETPSQSSYTKDLLNGAILVGLSGATTGLLYGTKDVPRMITKPILATVVSILANNETLLRFLSDNKGTRIFADSIDFLDGNNNHFTVRNNLGTALRIILPYVILSSLFANTDSETTLDILEEEIENAKAAGDEESVAALRETYDYLKKKEKDKSFMESIKGMIPFLNKDK